MNGKRTTNQRITSDSHRFTLIRADARAPLKTINQFFQLSILLPAMMAAGFFIACGLEPQATPTSQPTSEPPAPVATAVAEAEATVIAANAKSGIPYCGRLCQPDFWVSADVTMLDAELERGASANARDRRGFGPLHYAALLSDISVVAALLDQDADIDATSDRGLTPLHVAATGGSALLSGGHYTMRRYQDPAVIALLLERGADVNPQNDWGVTPLHEVRDPVVAALLLTYGADIEAKEEGGATPLHSAADWNSEPAIIVILLEHGADVHATNGEGKTACQLATEREKPEEVRNLVCP